MLSISRVTDLGESTCPTTGHGNYVTTYISGADTVFINNLQVVRISDLGSQSCGHTSTALTGSGSVFAENLPVHRMTDIGEGGGGDIYTSITGSEDTFAGD